ncbi:DUF808 domain-containing protein [Acinetobacter rathckeae]|uniref:DUF808 domain-containing protein n=1 Tax=Acinetobacter rathckeae TaxID=2605272 RepID=UPI0018A2DD78|nr:DUF808 domain-containing protein [Acinetobacter rathckeae]MBF7687331.1 DUF808 domain-containing protein [Acinetobacter rathckeae]MBF7695917.1 DUF808 domain-containing protein [Acinetobacter rathckeae]
MAGSLLLLLDDIATVLDDVAVMSKTAAKQTAGVLGDDLALNAQQVTGVSADRELPVVWKVAKGSFYNKCILVPLALLISVFIPWLITPLLVIGGLFLCYEGVEKVMHMFMHKASSEKTQTQGNQPQDLASYENEKVKGAIRTDFILSAEIIVITLGTVATAPLIDKIIVMSIISVAMTIGVYGFVALIVKIDDFGLFLQKKTAIWQQKIGQLLLAFAPKLMKTLSVVGTVAMFLVGGGIIAHAVPAVHHFTEHNTESLGQIPNVGFIIGSLVPTGVNLVLGVVAGAVVVLLVMLVQKIFKKSSAS